MSVEEVCFNINQLNSLYSIDFYALHAAMDTHTGVFTYFGPLDHFSGLCGCVQPVPE